MIGMFRCSLLTFEVSDLCVGWLVLCLSSFDDGCPIVGLWVHPVRSLRQALITVIDDEPEDGYYPELLHLIEHSCFDFQDDSLACLVDLNM